MEETSIVDGSTEPVGLEHRKFLMRNLEVIHDILSALYQSPDHGNKSNPMDELVYIHLSKKTHEKGYTSAYTRLAHKYPQWEGLAEANPASVKTLIESAGLGSQRTEELIQNTKRIRALFGRETLDPLKDWPEKKVFRFLTGLSGIGPKSAKCIMMYSLGMEVFPVDTHVHTVCERLGLIDGGLNHKKAQEELGGRFPERYRYGLHVNMVAHGRAMCKERGKPRCTDCHLSKFCFLYRRGVRDSPKDGPKLIDLFCGPGGATLGLAQSGFSVRYAMDIDVRATDTYYLNRPELTFNEVVTEDIGNPASEGPRGVDDGRVDLIIGGPPCQGWSSIGKNWTTSGNGREFLDDQKNALYVEFVKKLEEYKPKYFVMENVPGLLRAKHGKYAKVIQEDFRTHKYVSVIIMLNAADYGIPQNRSRTFFIGRRIYRGKEGVAYRELERISRLIKKMRVEKRLSFREGVKGLPHLEPGAGENVMRMNKTNDSGSRARSIPNGSNLVYNHFARKHNSRDLEIYRELSEGENYLSLSKRTDREELLPYSDKSFHTKFRKIDGDRPCHTIISHLSKDANSYIHPEDNRGITVREAARIQSFPDDFIFLGEGFQQFIQVGNAVPPRLSETIGCALLSVICRHGGKRNGKERRTD